MACFHPDHYHLCMDCKFSGTIKELEPCRHCFDANFNEYTPHTCAFEPKQVEENSSDEVDE